MRPIDLGLFKFHFPNEPRPDAWTKKVISDGGYNGFNLVKEFVHFIQYCMRLFTVDAEVMTWNGVI